MPEITEKTPQEVIVELKAKMDIMEQELVEMYTQPYETNKAKLASTVLRGQSKRKRQSWKGNKKRKRIASLLTKSLKTISTHTLTFQSPL